jgi:hypothetical protein
MSSMGMGFGHGPAGDTQTMTSVIRAASTRYDH